MALYTPRSHSDALELRSWKSSDARSELLLTRVVPAVICEDVTFPLRSLPWELQLVVVSHLNLRDVLRLRHTCRDYFHYLTSNVLRDFFSAEGLITFELLNCCIECLSMPTIGYLALDNTRPQETWRSMCFRCWRVKRSPIYRRTPYNPVSLVSGQTAHPCLFCGWPACNNEIHLPCRFMLLTLNTVWCSMSGLYFFVHAMTVTTAWTYYTGVPAVLLPATINFFSAFTYFMLFSFDVLQATNTSHYRLPVELVSTVLWTPATFHASHEIADGRAHWVSYPGFVCGVFAVNLLTHILHLIGFCLPLIGYDPRSHALPDVSIRRKSLYVLCSFLVYWARAKYR
ncbi:hypothetical protein GGR54DRAFT_265250 [Hypoxylon sp. NC1633]|nr:hypothetical protein GGR54DRAFT_265250 [Hypoxylon sp. NC1633]